MNSVEAFARARAARANNNPLKVFDWIKAAERIKEVKPQVAEAGLEADLEWTGGIIYEDEKPNYDSYCYLASIWATPILILDGEEEYCWKYEEDTPGWGSDTRWPEEALAVLNAQA